MAETLEFVNAAGAVLSLSSGNIQWMYGIDGRGMSPVSFEETPNRIGSGSVLTELRADARTVMIPLSITGDTRTVLRDASRLLNPTLGDGRLVSQVDAEDERELVCRYVGGLQWAEDMRYGMKQVASFRAFDPFWQDTEDANFAYARNNIEPWLPFPPVQAVADDFFAEDNLNNSGDVEAWPVWTITGPTTEVTLTNLTTGRALKIVVALTEVETLIVDTRPSSKTVVDQSGANRFATLDSEVDDLFPFAPGTNALNIAVTGGDDATTNVALAWRRRWLTA